jgi:GNAT superfamily N-acetyltransferase
MICSCNRNFIVRLCRDEQYFVFKKQLDIGKHPTFIGRQMMMRNAKQGGALLYLYETEIVAVSLINPRLGILLALNVHPKHRGHGLGAAIIRYLVPNFVRVLSSKVGWFERLGYVCIGQKKRGVRLFTQVMARNELFGLAGNLRKAWGNEIEESPVLGEESPAQETKMPHIAT